MRLWGDQPSQLPVGECTSLETGRHPRKLNPGPHSGPEGPLRGPYMAGMRAPGHPRARAGMSMAAQVPAARLETPRWVKSHAAERDTAMMTSSLQSPTSVGMNGVNTALMERDQNIPHVSQDIKYKGIYAVGAWRGSEGERVSGELLRGWRLCSVYGLRARVRNL